MQQLDVIDVFYCELDLDFLSVHFPNELKKKNKNVPKWNNQMQNGSQYTSRMNLKKVIKYGNQLQIWSQYTSRMNNNKKTSPNAMIRCRFDCSTLLERIEKTY